MAVIIASALLLLQVYAVVALNAAAMRRSDVLRVAAASAASAAIGVGAPEYVAAASTRAAVRPTNEVVDVIDGIRQKRLGGTDIIVSEVGLGTQRWGSTDFNAPNEAACHAMMNKAVLDSGVTLIDTAEQYPIPSGSFSPEGYTEEIIGSWLRQDRSRRREVVIASKITGGDNINKRNIMADCEASLKRLGTDYLDVYLLHWPARYTPQSNWGQSLEFNPAVQQLLGPSASFAEVVEAMGKLQKQGKIRGWGMCNDNAYGLAASAYTARAMGLPPPCVLQNDYSILDRRIEVPPPEAHTMHVHTYAYAHVHMHMHTHQENGVSEASSPLLENTGFMAYNVLAGGVLTGKYLKEPAAIDQYNAGKKGASMKRFRDPRGRMDENGWGQTLYRYRSGPAEEATRAYAKLAKQHGMTLTELCLRWARQRAAVTSSLLGVSSLTQLEEDLSYYKKDDVAPLPRELLWEIDRVHMRNRLPIFASTKVAKDWDEGAFGFGEVDEIIP